MSDTPLPSEIQAAVDASLSGDALRGLVMIFCAITASLNPAFLPTPAFGLLAALCEDLTRWVVVAGPTSPYCHVRPPVGNVGVSGCVVDLRHVRSDTPRATGFPPDVWARVREAARRYGQAHTAPTATQELAAMRPEGRA